MKTALLAFLFKKLSVLMIKKNSNNIEMYEEEN